VPSGRLAAIKRAGWGLGDQAFSSLTNFALGVFVARTVGPQDFGAFSLAFATYLVAMGVSRAVAIEPLTIRYSACSEDEWRAAAARGTGAAAVAGILTGLVCLAAGLMADGALGQAFVGLAIFLPGLLIQDSWRFAFFALGRGRSALVNDAVWAAVLFPLLGLVAYTGERSVIWPVLAWGCAASTAAIVGAFQGGVIPRPLLARSWWREHRDIAPHYIGEFVSLTGARQLGIFGVGGVAGLVAVGALRAGQILLGPMKVLFMGIHLVAIPEAARMLKAGNRLTRAMVALSAVLTTVGFAGGLFLVFLPDQFGNALLRDTWAPAQPVLLPLTFVVGGSGAVTGAVVGLRALAASSRSFRARGVMSALELALMIGGAVIGGAVGAAWGSAAATWLGVLVWWIQFRGAQTPASEALPGPAPAYQVGWSGDDPA
jgi:O-antigen/teichoic acid export membrane protein